MSVVEVRALKALYRNHPATPPNMRYSSATKRLAFANRDMLLAWAATQPDDVLLDCRNLGTSSLAWIREQTGDPKSPFADLEDENADLRMALAAASEELTRLREAVAHTVKAIESVRESGALDDDGLLWLDRECAAAANAGYHALRAALRVAYREDTDDRP